MIYLANNTYDGPTTSFPDSKLAELRGIEPTHEDNEIKKSLQSPTESGAIEFNPGKDGEQE